MARPLRIEYPGAFYHVMARGDDRKAIFWDDELGGRRPGQVTDLYMYDPDQKKFSSIGIGTVSEDGTRITADAGIKKAGYLFAGADIVIADLLKANAPVQKTLTSARFFSGAEILFANAIQVYVTLQKIGLSAEVQSVNLQIKQSINNQLKPIVDERVFLSPEESMSLEATGVPGGNPTSGADVPRFDWVVVKDRNDPALDDREIISILGIDGSKKRTIHANAGKSGVALIRVSVNCACFKGDVSPQSLEKFVEVVVVGVKNIKFRNSKMISFRDIDQSYKFMGVFTNSVVDFSFDSEPDASTLNSSDINWGGEASGSLIQVPVTFSQVGTRSVSVDVLGQSKSTRVEVVDFPAGIGIIEFALLSPVNSAIATLHNLINPAGDPSTLEPFVWASMTYAGPQGNTLADAARHAYWNCLLTIYINSAYAKGLTDAYEVSNPGPSTETVMDLFNNSIGRGLGIGITNQTNEACQGAVNSAVSAGDTVYLDSSYGAENTAEDALLQPTNQ